MKSDVMPSIVDKSIINEIVEVKETVAEVIRISRPRRSFTATDLWNIRRNAKSASGLVRR